MRECARLIAQFVAHLSDLTHEFFVALVLSTGTGTAGTLRPDRQAGTGAATAAHHAAHHLGERVAAAHTAGLPGPPPPPNGLSGLSLAVALFGALSRISSTRSRNDFSSLFSPASSPSENRFRPSCQPILAAGKGCHVSDEHAGPNVIPTRTISDDCRSRFDGPSAGRTHEIAHIYGVGRPAVRERDQPAFHAYDGSRAIVSRTGRASGRSRSRNRTARGRRTPADFHAASSTAAASAATFGPVHAVDQSIGDLGLDLAGVRPFETVWTWAARSPYSRSRVSSRRRFGDADLERVGARPRCRPRAPRNSPFRLSGRCRYSGHRPTCSCGTRSRGPTARSQSTCAPSSSMVPAQWRSPSSTRVPRRPRAVGGRPPQRRRSPAATSRSCSSGSRPVARVRVGTGRK